MNKIESTPPSIDPATGKTGDDVKNKGLSKKNVEIVKLGSANLLSLPAQALGGIAAGVGAGFGAAMGALFAGGASAIYRGCKHGSLSAAKQGLTIGAKTGAKAGASVGALALGTPAFAAASTILFPLTIASYALGYANAKEAKKGLQQSHMLMSVIIGTSVESLESNVDSIRKKFKSGR